MTLRRTGIPYLPFTSAKRLPLFIRLRRHGHRPPLRLLALAPSPVAAPGEDAEHRVYRGPAPLREAAPVCQSPARHERTEGAHHITPERNAGPVDPCSAAAKAAR